MSPDQAKEVYRQAWATYCLTPEGDEKKLELEKVMDSMQSSIARGPFDPEWIAFAKTLPGYLDFWKGLKEKLLGGLTPRHRSRIPKNQ